MANQPVPSGSALKSPQVVLAVVSGAVTIIAAVIGVLPNLVGTDQPPTATPLPIIITATPVQAVETVTIPTDAPTVPPLQPTPLTILLTDTGSTTIPLSQAGTVSNTAPNAQFLYDDVSFTLLNLGDGVLSLEGVTFQSTTGAWDARQWGTSIYDRLPAGQCLRLRDATAGQRTPPNPCVDRLYGLIEVGASALFWVNTQEFMVMQHGKIIATCATNGGMCTAFIPSS